MHQVRLEAVVLEQPEQPAPPERGPERHRRPGRQIADQPQQRLRPVDRVLVQLHLSVLGDYRHLGPLAVHVDADVNRQCRVSSAELVLSPGASRYWAELGRGPALIGSDECVSQSCQNRLWLGTHSDFAESELFKPQSDERARCGPSIGPVVCHSRR